MKKESNRAPQNFMEAAASFEKFKIDEIKKSRKIAWIISAICTGVTAISIAAFLVALLIRPEPEPVIIKVDQSTGYSEVMRSIKDTDNKYDEVVNKYWLAKYVILREGYDWYTLSEQYESIKIMSNSDIFREYDKEIRKNDAPLNTLKDKFKIVAKIISISFVGDMAQVRYTTEKQSLTGDNIDNAPIQKWLATIAYEFDSGFMTDQQRLVNPLGFKTISFRVDPEVLK